MDRAPERHHNHAIGVENEGLRDHVTPQRHGDVLCPHPPGLQDGVAPTLGA